MHPLLRLPYATLIVAARALTRLPLPGDGKIVRSIRARRGVVERIETWARVHRDPSHRDPSHRDPSRPLLWIHAPSVGEGLQARPVLERLRARHPALLVAYTFFSPSAERFAASLVASGTADFADYLPFDDATQMERALEALRPTALVFSKVDIWPRLTERAAARRVPLGLISATMAAGSARRGFLARGLSRDAFAALNAIGAVDVSDAERLAAAGARKDRIRITGDTRYDQVAARAGETDRSHALLGPLIDPLVGPKIGADGEGATLVAGSTWPSDELVLLPAWATIHRELPAARLIIAPHEPTAAHLDFVREWSALAGFTVATLGSPESRTADVVLVDRVGVLGDLYALADAAYVGGGFHAAGLHSVLEPAAFGVPVIFGPRHGKSRDARLLLECRGGAAAHNVASLTDALRIAFTEPDTRRAAGDAARQLVASGLGAADRSTVLVEELLGLSA